VGDPQHQPAVDHALDVETILHELRLGQDLARELEAAQAEGTARTGGAAPAEEKAEQLPQGIEPEAAGHDGIFLEMALEEPEVGTDVELGLDEALVVGAAGGRDVGDAVEHQHRRQRQPGVARAEELAVTASDQLVVVVAGLGNELPRRCGRGSRHGYLRYDPTVAASPL